MTGDPIIDPPFDVAGYNRHLEAESRARSMTVAELLAHLIAMTANDPSTAQLPVYMDTHCCVQDVRLAGVDVRGGKPLFLISGEE